MKTLDKIDELLAAEFNPELDDKPIVDEVDDDKPKPIDEPKPIVDDDDDEPIVDDDDEPKPIEDEELLNSINDFAAELDMDIGDMYELEVNISGNDSKSIGQLKDFYAANSDVEGLRQSITEQKEELIEEMQVIKNTPAITNQMLQAQAKVLSIASQYQQVDWAALRQQNPAEYSALQNDYKQAYSAAEAEAANANSIVMEHAETAKAIEHKKLLDIMPELKDDGVRKATGERVLDYAAKYGFTQDEVGQIEDSRLLRLLIEASKVVKAQDSAKEKKKNKEVPAGSKPAGNKSTPTGRKASLKRLTDTARKSGQTSDKVSAISALLG